MNLIYKNNTKVKIIKTLDAGLDLPKFDYLTPGLRPDMLKFQGVTTKIEKVERNEIKCIWYRLKCDGGLYAWDHRWLIPDETVQKFHKGDLVIINHRNIMMSPTGCHFAKSMMQFQGKTLTIACDLTYLDDSSEPEDHYKVQEVNCPFTFWAGWLEHSYKETANLILKKDLFEI